ncbi:MAG: protein kinase [Myxococcota bacterium]
MSNDPTSAGAAAPAPTQTVPPSAPGGVGAPDGEGLLATGSMLGGYRIVGLLGRGGMGEVYEGWDDRLARPVALKRIPVSRQADAESRARLWREARTLAALRHAGIVTIFEIGEDAASGSLFLAMELVRGRALATLGPRALPLRLAVYVAREVAAALGAAHAAGITHRDVKPANILIEDDGSVRVVDFGLALRVDELDQRLTRSGALLGTPGYMAPEVVAGTPGVTIGPAADVFAIGTLLYRLISGLHPFARDSAQATAMALAGALHTPLGELGLKLPPAVVALVERCLAVAPADRPPHGTAVADALARLELPPAGPLSDREALAAQFRDASPGLAADPPFDTRVAQAGRRARRPRWLAPALLGAAALAVAGAVALAVGSSGGASSPSGAEPGTTLAGPTTASPPAPTRAAEGTASVAPIPDAAASPPASFVLPPRPAVVVLGFSSARPAERAHAEVLADVVRARLDEDPEHLLAASLELTRALIAEGPSIGPELAPERFARPGRTLGHIDVVVRGSFRDAAAGAPASVTAELVDTLGARVFDSLTLEAPDVMSLGDALGKALVARLGGTPPATPARFTRVPEAWSAWMAAHAAQYSADLGAVTDNVDWALRVDPTFGMARVEQLALFKQEGREEDLLRRGKELLAAESDAAGPTLTAHARAHAEALIAYTEGRLDDAVRALYAVHDRYPFDLESTDLLIALRFAGRARDLDEAERLARRQLTLAPRLEVPASRRIRTLGFRGRGDEADRFIHGLGVPLDDASFADVFAEVDLFAGRFAAASEGFQRVFARESGNLYAEHMAIAAELLSGRCDKAAGRALDRIAKFKSIGVDSNLGWTYSLATQALVCWEQWDALERTLVEWSAFDDGGKAQSLDLRERVAAARAALLPAPERAAEEARLAERWRAFPADAAGVRALYAGVTSDTKALGDILRDAERAAVDTATTSVERVSARHFAARVRGRLARLAGRPAAEVLAAYDDGVIPWSEVQSEAQLVEVVISIADRADVREALGDLAGARADWQSIVDAGYRRLWASQLWMLARHRLDALR